MRNEALTRVRESHDISHWVRFFLSAVIETANKGKTTFEEILSLRQEVNTLILGMGRRAKNAQLVLNRMYKRPAITVAEVAQMLDLSHTAATNLIKQFEALGVVRELTGYHRNRVYVFERYLDLFSG